MQHFLAKYKMFATKTSFIVFTFYISTGVFASLLTQQARLAYRTMGGGLNFIQVYL